MGREEKGGPPPPWLVAPRLASRACSPAHAGEVRRRRTSASERPVRSVGTGEKGRIVSSLVGVRADTVSFRRHGFFVFQPLKGVGWCC